DEDLTAMLEGREDLSEVQENPFAEMMKADDAAEGATVPAEGIAPAETPPEPTDISPIEKEIPGPARNDEEGTTPIVEKTSAETNEEWITTPTARDDPGTSPGQAQEESPAEEPQPSDNMSDEEFEAFMKKAQAFYDTQANEDSDNSDDDDVFPNIEVHSGD
ncbi:MAG: hypothetical protein IKT05_04525, partial [Fibrobacter sp.]|nr:hypothetical protein [Fibrobacter sp.]